MNKLCVLGVAACFAALSGCAMSSHRDDGPIKPNPLYVDDTPQTPPDERMADLLQEAKQQYDDGHYPTSFRMAEQAENLERENEGPEEDLALAITIQGYSLLQMGRIDDYFVEKFGTQRGAITKFKQALKIRDDDFRAQLGVSLARFRRHGDSIRKAESLAQGIISLESIRADCNRAFKQLDSEQGKSLLNGADRRLGLLKASREQLIKLGYIFRDPTTIKVDKDGAGPKPKWLGAYSEGEGKLAVEDIGWSIDDALNDKESLDDDLRTINAKAALLIKSWHKVKNYWRMHALKDLQSARDGFLAVRNRDRELARELNRMEYFWVDRDLTFVFQSLGAFFLDIGLEKTRLKAVAEGVDQKHLEARAREIYLGNDFNSYEKSESKRNYQASLDYTRSFVRKHRAFELARINKRDKAELNEENSNPFMVDLVSRYQTTMDELIQEDRSVAENMILEAAAVCIDPLFQISDVKQANAWANELQSLEPGNPIHHFIRATAYFGAEDWETAKTEYEAFMQQSSVTEDASRRSIARMRIMQCEQNLKHKAGAGEDESR